MPGRNGRGEKIFNGRRLFTTKKTGDGIGMAWASNVTEQNGGLGSFSGSPSTYQRVIQGWVCSWLMSTKVLVEARGI